MSDLFDLTGKVALVTGASSGLGVQFARALAKQGAKLALLARREEKLQAVQKEIEDLGVECIYQKCDVSDSNNIKEAVKAVLDHYGTIDILVNNAGIGNSTPAADLDIADWNQVINMNLSSLFYVAKEVAPTMINNKYGKIINIGSVHSEAAMHPTTWPVPAYASAKHGVKGLTKSLAAEWAPYNITVNAIGPAYFASEMTQDMIGDEGFLQVMKTYCPMGRTGRPGELDGALVYFASDASSYTSGQLLLVDGAWTTI